MKTIFRIAEPNLRAATVRAGNRIEEKRLDGGRVILLKSSVTSVRRTLALLHLGLSPRDLPYLQVVGSIIRYRAALHPSAWCITLSFAEQAYIVLTFHGV